MELFGNSSIWGLELLVCLHESTKANRANTAVIELASLNLSPTDANECGAYDYVVYRW